MQTFLACAISRYAYSAKIRQYLFSLAYAKFILKSLSQFLGDTIRHVGYWATLQDHLGYPDLLIGQKAYTLAGANMWNEGLCNSH